MAALLLGECFPFRMLENSTLAPFRNTQGKLLASACGLSLDELLKVCDGHYLLPKYVGTWHRSKPSYLTELRDMWERKKCLLLGGYDLVFVIGKRLAVRVIIHKQVNFFEPIKRENTTFICLPNPMAELWWKDVKNIEAVNTCVNAALMTYT